MKSRSILLILLLSLSFTIAHDFIFSQKNDSPCLSIIEPNINDTCCQEKIKMHEIFHILAILNPSKTIEEALSNKPISFTKTLYSPFFYHSFFKPPKK